MNAAATMTGWLDAHVFKGARLAELRRQDRPAVILNATDMANAVPFVFGPELAIASTPVSIWMLKFSSSNSSSSALRLSS